MKKVLIMIGSSALVTTAATSTIAVNSITQNSMVETGSISNLAVINYNSEDWKVSAEAPRTLLEKIAGIWRLNLNHELTTDIISGSINSIDFLKIISDVIAGIDDLVEKVGSVIGIVDMILKLGENLLSNADEGNGVLIKFTGWAVPTEVVSSTHDWN